MWHMRKVPEDSIERDREIIHAVPFRGRRNVVDSVEFSSGWLIGKKSRPSELTEFV